MPSAEGAPPPDREAESSTPEACRRLAGGQRRRHGATGRGAESSTPEACIPVWDSRREELGDTIVNTLSDYAPNLKELIVARQVITPLDLESKYGLSGGHIHHGEMSLDQLFAFRPLIGWAQYRTPIENLYLCGAGTHPGGGVTGASGLNASREIIKDLKRRKT